MHPRLRGFLFFVGAAAVFGVSLAVAQTPAYRAPHRADGHPNLGAASGRHSSPRTGICRITRRSPDSHPELEGAYDAAPGGQGVVEGGAIPYQPWALAKKKENFANRCEGRRRRRQEVARARRSRSQVLHARRAARHVHAVSVSDHSGIATDDPDGL